MGKVQQRLLAAVSVAALCMPVDGRRFYPDDPIPRVPEPMNVDKAERRKLSDYHDFFHHTFGRPGEKHEPRVVPAQAVNTLGEVPDSTWFTNRHGRRRLTKEELARGPGNMTPPATEQPWKVVAAKSEGITPGLTIEDAKGRRYLLKFDPLAHPELASGADVIGARFFYALGYFTPENYIVHFTRDRLRVDPKATFVDYRGVERSLREGDIDSLMKKVRRDADGRYRGLASLFLDGKPLGPFRYYGTRSDDPNDIVPHEHRRDLRGLYVFAAWLNHSDTKALNSLDTLIKDGSRQYIRHHLIDFGAILGSDSFTAKSPRSGNVYMFDWRSSAAQFLTLGLYTPRWMYADYPHEDSVGRIEAEAFEADKWKPNYYNPAFSNCLPDDGYWAAKQVMAFTDDDIRTLVQTGEYSDGAAVEFLIKALIARRDNIGRTWFGKVLPLDNFRVSSGRLEFEDLGARFKLTPARDHRVVWAAFDNETDQRSSIAGGGTGWTVPQSPSGFVVADITADVPGQSVTVYIRQTKGNAEVVGVERKW